MTSYTTLISNQLTLRTTALIKARTMTVIASTPLWRRHDDQGEDYDRYRKFIYGGDDTDEAVMGMTRSTAVGAKTGSMAVMATISFSAVVAGIV